jgi:hypothetical protein
MKDFKMASRWCHGAASRDALNPSFDRSQFEKSTIVWKLRDARDRKRALSDKCEGRTSHAEANTKAVALTRKLPK